MEIILALPLAFLCLAAYGLSEMKEKGRRHKVSLGIAVAAMVLCALLAGASMKDGGILYQIFHTGTPGILTAAGLMVLLPVAALICIFMPSLPGNGRWDRAMRIACFLATGGWCLFAFGATIAIARC